MKTMALALLALASAPAQEKKPAPPDAAAEKRAEREIREVFKSEYAKKAPADRVALAGLLLSQGQQTKDDLAARYVLFREARDLAAAAGDFRTALRAVDELARSFEVDALRMRSAVLAAAGKAAQSPEEFQALAEASLAAADEAVGAEDFETAERCASEAVSASKKSKVLPLVFKADAKAKEVAERKTQNELLKKARQTLASAPDDPDANLTVGRHECFQRGAWAAGLPRLAKGSDAALRDLAAGDLKAPAETEEQVALGDRWWEVAEKQPTAAKELVRQRAAHWYGLAAPRTAGLTRIKIDNRRREALESSAIDLLRLIDPKQDTVKGEWVFEGSALVCVQRLPAARVQIPYLPPEEYDVTIVAERLVGVEAINVGLVKGDVKFHMVVDGWAPLGYFSGLSMIDKKYGNENETSRPGGLLVNNRPSTIVCFVRNSGLKMTVDGKTIFEWTGDVRRLSNYFVLNTPHPRALYISGWDSKYRFSKISLVPIAGSGQKLR